jgi:Right handed beta helix region
MILLFFLGCTASKGDDSSDSLAEDRDRADSPVDSRSDSNVDSPGDSEGWPTGTTWYISPSGDDANDGLSPQSPFRLIATGLGHAQPGDRVFLEAGATFTETVYIGPGGGGSDGLPITLSSDSNNPATVQAGPNKSAIEIDNVGNLTIAHLIVVGPGRSRSDAVGVYAHANGGRHANLEFIDLDISEFHEGLAVWSWENADDGFDQVLIDGCELHHNLQGGGSTYGAGVASMRDITVRNSSFHHNPGDPSVSRPSGDGFVFGGVTRGLIEYSVAHHNGGDGTNNAGPVGIWAYNSAHITIQYCESYANSSMYMDGDGFDLDVGVSDSVIQYCYSHDNRGAGYLFSQQGPIPWQRNTIRYNISENDGAGGLMGAITFYSAPGRLGLEEGWVYGNTVYAGAGPALNTSSETNISGQKVFNNIFVSDNGQMLVWDWSGSSSANGIEISGNLYWAADGSPSFEGYSSLAAWQAASGHEAGGEGRYADPLLLAAGQGGSIGDPSRLSTLDAYTVAAGSPAIDAGVDPARYVTDPGSSDYYGQSIPAGAGWDMGAQEWR